jgi:hypothetical protein
MAVDAPTSACPRDAGAAKERKRVERGAAQQPGRGLSLVTEVGTGGDWQVHGAADGWVVALQMDGCASSCARVASQAGTLAAASMRASNGTDRRRNAPDRRGRGSAPALACERAAAAAFFRASQRASDTFTTARLRGFQLHSWYRTEL